MIYYWCSNRSIKGQLGWGTKKVVISSVQGGEVLLMKFIEKPCSGRVDLYWHAENEIQNQLI